MAPPACRAAGDEHGNVSQQIPRDTALVRCRYKRLAASGIPLGLSVQDGEPYRRKDICAGDEQTRPRMHIHAKE